MNFPRPVNTPWFVPYLTVRDASATIVFYRNVFDFGMQDEMHDHSRPIHVEIIYQGQLTLMFAPEGVFSSTAKAPAGAGPECPQSFHLYCGDVDTMYRHVLDQGVTSIVAPHDVFQGERYTTMRDPDDYCWGLVCRPVAARSRHRLIALPDSPQRLL